MTATPDDSIAPLLDRIETRLGERVPPVLSGHAALGLAMRDSLLSPGKRLRPLITLIVAEDLGGSANAALDAGCAVEMVHAASLILDDLPCMDDAALRRGQPTIHRGHGEDVAVLSSIAMLSGAFETLSRIADLDAERRAACVGVLAGAVGSQGLVAGQFQDLRGGQAQRAVSEIADANGRKTGSLFLAAVELGAIVSDAPSTHREDLKGFARELGMAFQLLDDLLDTGASAASIGKDVGKDDGKSTIVSLIGPASVERLIERHVEAAGRHLTGVFGAGSRLHRLVDGIFLANLPQAAGSRSREPHMLEHEAGLR